MDGKTARGASSPANPALHMPLPLSTTRAATSSSPMAAEKSESQQGYVCPNSFQVRLNTRMKILTSECVGPENDRSETLLDDSVTIREMKMANTYDALAMQP